MPSKAADGARNEEAADADEQMLPRGPYADG